MELHKAQKYSMQDLRPLRCVISLSIPIFLLTIICASGPLILKHILTANMALFLMVILYMLSSNTQRTPGKFAILSISCVYLTFDRLDSS